MKPALIDTDILSLFLRGDRNVRSRFERYLESSERLHLSIITVYEVVSGLRYRDARRQLGSFRQLVAASEVWPVTESSVEISAEIYATLRSQGRLIDDLDLLIAGIALANDFTLVTHNRRHFDRIHALEVQDWSETA